MTFELYIRRGVHLERIYTVFQKKADHQTHAVNSVKPYKIFKNLSLADSAVNLQSSDY